MSFLVSLILFIIDIILLFVLIYFIFLFFTIILWVINLMKSSTDSLIDSNTIVFSQDLFCLSDCCILAVYQLKQFELMNHVYISLISNNIVDLVHSIITLYFISVEYQSADTSDFQQICGNFSQFINLDYFISWSLTKSSLTKTICCFKKDLTSLYEYFIFLTWVSFQSFPTDLEQPNQSD